MTFKFGFWASDSSVYVDYASILHMHTHVCLLHRSVHLCMTCMNITRPTTSSDKSEKYNERRLRRLHVFPAISGRR